MQSSGHSSQARPGFLLLDALLGVALFAVFVSSIIVTLIFSQQSTHSSGERIRGVYLAEQAMQVIRSMRDEDFNSLTVGTHGIRIGDDGKWEVSGTGATSNDGYTTQIALSDVSTDVIGVIVHTSWTGRGGRSGNIYLSGEVTNWRKIQEIGNWSSVSLEGSFIHDDTPLFNHTVISGNYAFVTSETSDGGVGLYIFDISDLTNPIQVATSFDLGAPGYQLTIDGTSLIILTGDISEEIRMYDISSPTTFSSDDLIASYNLPGNARARSLALFNDVLFIGATQDGVESEFYTLNYSGSGTLSALDAIHDDGSINDIALYEGYAYLASTMDSSELRVVDIFDPSDLVFATGEGYNLTDVPDANSIMTVDGFAALGRANGDIIEELVLLEIDSSPVPSPPPGPWYQEAGDSVNEITTEPGGRYAFVASSFDSKELQILDLEDYASGGSPEIDFYNTSTGEGRSVTYDASRDRVFLTTNTAFLIIKPGP